MFLTKSQLAAFQWEYNTLLTVVQPGADILDRIGYLEQTFDMIDLGEIRLDSRPNLLKSTYQDVSHV